MRVAGLAGHIRNATFYRRRLPHWQPEGARDGRAFVVWDRLLGEARSGPSWLRRPEIAGLVREAIHNVAPSRLESRLVGRSVVVDKSVHAT